MRGGELRRGEVSGLAGLIFMKVFRWNRIVPATAIRIAAADAFCGKPASGNRAVSFQGVEGVLGTARLKAAIAERAKEENLGRRKRAAIKPHEQNQYMLSRIHRNQFAPLACFNNPALRSDVKKSFSTLARVLPAMDARATRTRSIGSVRSY